MKKLKFAEPLSKLILDGKKRTTWRINDEKNIEVGDEISLCTRDGAEFTKAKVTYVKETTFEAMTEEDKSEHEAFQSDEEMYRTYSEYYQIDVTPKTNVKIIKFEIL